MMTDDKATPLDDSKPDSSKTPPVDSTPDDKNSTDKAKREQDRQLESGEESPS